jgi:hypothetical protein
MKVRNRLFSAVPRIGLFLLFSFSVASAQQQQQTAPVPITPHKKPAKPVRARANSVAQPAAIPAATSTTPSVATAASPAAAPVQPAAAYAATPSAASSGMAPAPADRGTLTQGNVIFTPVGCVHNGTKAVCTFTFVNQGKPGNMVGNFILPTAQFVDDAHVPHRSDARYFLDKYGTRQPKLYANSGDTGTFVAEYVNVDARVATGEFHMRDQTVGGITVSQPITAPSQGAAQKK